MSSVLFTHRLTAADIAATLKNTVVLSSQPGVWGTAELPQRSPTNLLDLSSTTIFSETVTTSISSSIDTGGGSSLFPARAGFSTAALSAAIAVPGAETFSKGKTLDQVATAARNGLDQKYASVNASGSPFDKNSPTDWNTVFGDFDRRSLYAVASNQGGNFSKDEQQAAKSVLDQQLQYAGGFFVLKSGPDPVGDVAGYAKQLSWLDGLSSDEKTSSDWAAARSSAQGLLQASLYTAVADAFYATGVDANTANLAILR